MMCHTGLIGSILVDFDVSKIQIESLMALTPPHCSEAEPGRRISPLSAEEAVKKINNKKTS